MTILSNADLVVQYDLNQTIVSTRVLGFDASNSKEFTAQCLKMEIVRAVLSDGISLLNWNAMEEPEPWNTWWSTIRTAALTATSLYRDTSVLSSGDKDTIAATAATVIERGYTNFIDGISAENKISCSKSTGIQ